VLGNAAEWCRDFTSPYFLTLRAGDGLRLRGMQDRRTARGGHCFTLATVARASARKSPPASQRHEAYGVRPVRALSAVPSSAPDRDATHAPR
jgi:formylglycine-generating enzyme required for sulfatase activity